ncbi:MAG: acyl-CoA dehydrogenase, partial [Microthrixaceae bacterium]
MNASATTTVDSDEAFVISLVNELLAEFPPASTDERRFLEAQFEFDKGPAWVHFPVGHGGLGLSPKLQRLVIQRV